MNLLLQEYWQKPVLIWRRVNKWQSRQGQDVVVSAASGTTGIAALTATKKARSRNDYKCED